jgi:integrase
MGLTARKVARERRPGRYPDGDNLYLQITATGGRSWVLRYERDGKEHMHGLGTVRDFTLSEARERARKARQLLADGIDPIDQRKAERAARTSTASTMLTFVEAAKRYIEAHEAEWTSAKHATDYRVSLERYAFPLIGALDTAAIGVPHVLQVLEQRVPAASNGQPAGIFWAVRAVTADRVRGRIETILDWAMARGHRPKGANPAAWAGNLEHVLASPTKAARVNHLRAVPYAEISALMAKLAGREGIGAKALMFAILTAARRSEVLKATWDEIDLDNRLWTIPAQRMKSRREHRVPLSPQAVELLEGLPREAGTTCVFVGRGGAASATVMVQTLHRLGYDGATQHGFRSALADWAHECTSHSHHTIELSLAHRVGSETERAYRRADMTLKRRKLMEDWARFCCTAAAESVVPLRGAR